MNELLQINYETEQPTVSARSLHEALSIEKRFSAWFETNSQGFMESVDFTSVLSGTVVNNGASRELQDYNLSIDMAKHICMMSRTEKGKQCRQYFIDLEKAWNTPEQVMARALRLADKTIEDLKSRVIEMKPKAEYFDDLVERNLLTSFRDTAKELHIKEKDFISFLLSHRYVYRDTNGKLQAYAEYSESGKGLFDKKEYITDRHQGTQTLITPRGRETFRLLIKGM